MITQNNRNDTRHSPLPLRKAVMKIFISAVTIYLIVVFIVTLFQRKIIYYPHKLDTRYEFPPYVPAIEEFFAQCDDGVRLNGLFAPGKPGKPLILMFHGNAGNITHREFMVQSFSSYGYPVCIIDYHGYGKTGGFPSEENFYKDGETVLRWLDSEKNITSEHIVVFAKSLGSGVGVELALRYHFAGLILETPFASTVHVARAHFPYNVMPAGILIRDRFSNIDKIGRITSPVLIIHGTRDAVVPTINSNLLFDKAPEPKKLFIIDGAGHDNVQFVDPITYWKTVSTWISELQPDQQNSG